MTLLTTNVQIKDNNGNPIPQASVVDSNGRVALAVTLVDSSGNSTTAGGGGGGTTAVTVSVAVTPTVSATTYTTGLVIGGLMSFAGMARSANSTGLINSASVASKSPNTASIDIIVFGVQPGSIADTGNISTLAPADLAKIVCVFSLAEWSSIGAGSFGQAAPESRFFKCADGTNTQTLWAYAVARASVTLASTSDLTVTIRASQD